MFRRITGSRQPQSAPQIDRSHPLSSSLALLMPLSAGCPRADLITGRIATSTGSLALTPSSFGTAPLFGSSNYLTFNDPPTITSATQPVTFSWVSEGRATSAYSAILHWKPPGASQAFLIYRAAGDSAYQFAAGPGGSSSVFTAATGLQGNGTPERFVLVCLGGMAATGSANYKLFRNGVQVAAGSNTTFGASTSAVARIGALGSGSDPFEGLIANLAIFNRALTDSEAASLSANPWQIYAGRRPLYLPESAGGGAAELAGAATVSVTAAAELSTGIQLAGDATLSITATGELSDLSAGAELAGDASVGITASAALTTGIALAGAATLSITASASLSTGSGGTRVKGLKKTRYSYGRAPQRPDELPKFIQTEVQRIESGLESPFSFQTFEKLYVEPERKTAGAMVVYADGTTWDPGSGEGLYVHYAGTWKKLA